MELRRLTAQDYDALLSLWNEVFTRQNKRIMNFELELPATCHNNDLHMNRHFGVFEDGKLCAALGIYPLKTNICGQELLFSTVGNVATRVECEGKGYMKALMAKAMQELNRIGADASRLGGLRQRYNRYGYEDCGSVYKFVFTERNMKICCPDFVHDIQLIPVRKSDAELLALISRWQQEACKIYVERLRENEPNSFYEITTAWVDRLYIARSNEGKYIGYFCVNEQGDYISEIGAENPDAMLSILCQWQYNIGKPICIDLDPYRIDCIKKLYPICEEVRIESPSLFKIINWQKVTDALMKLKASYTDLADGSFVLEVQGYGKIKLFSFEKQCGCILTTEDADLSLDPLSASRFLFGRLPPCCVIPCPTVCSSFLPLPLAWNTHDRV